MKYFISYHYKSRFGSGFGRVWIQRESSRPIASIDDVEDIEKSLIKKNNFDSVTIINWQKFDER
jgi:hypothetical protein